MTTGFQTCGKYNYESRKIAARRARQYQGKGAKGKLHVYRCACGWWHVGHKPRLEALVEMRRK